MKKTFLAILLVFSIVTIESCKKDKETEFEQAPGTINTATIIAEKFNYKTSEIGVIEVVDYELTAESYEGAIGGVATSFFTLADNKLSFVIPDLSEGEHILTLSFGSNELTLNISNPSFSGTSTDRLASFIDFNNQEMIAINDEIVLDSMLSLDAAFVSEQAKIDQLYNDIVAALNNLSDADKVIAANFIDANEELFENSIEFQESSSQRWVLNYVCGQYVNHCKMGISVGVMAVGVWIMPALPPAEKLVSLGVACIGAKMAMKYKKKAEIDRILAEAFQKFFDLFNQGQRSTISVQSGQSFSGNLNVTYRTVDGINDVNNPSGIIQKYVSAFDDYNKIVDKCNDAIDFVNENVWLFNQDHLDHISILPVSSEARKYDDLSYLNIKAEDSRVEVNYTELSSGELELTLTLANGISEDVTADIIVTYNDGENEISDVLCTATVKEMGFDFTGFWTLSHYTMDANNVEYLHQQVRFTCNSSGYASSSEVMYPTNPPPNNTWEPRGSVSISYNNGQIVLNDQLGWYLDVNNFNDLTFYSTNWNTVYNPGDYYWKHKLER